jgi:hypothetical protein
LFIWQKVNFILFFVILLICAFSSTEIISLSDGNEDYDPHKQLFDLSKTVLSNIGNTLGDGLATSAGIKGMAKMTAKTGSFRTNVLSIGLEGAAGLIGTKVAQSDINTLVEGGSKAGINSTSTNSSNINNNNSTVNLGNQTNTENNTNLELFEFDFSCLSNGITIPINKYWIFSPNENDKGLIAMYFIAN